MKKISVFVDEKGKIKCLYNEDLNFKSFGEVNLARAASVEPDTQDQGRWEVRVFGEEGNLKTFNLRSEALLFEETAVIRRLRNGK